MRDYLTKLAILSQYSGPANALMNRSEIPNSCEMDNFWWLPYWWKVERITEPPRCVYSVSIIDAGKTLNYPDKNARNVTNGSGQPKTTRAITSATFDLSEVTTYGAIPTNAAYIGNVSEAD